MGKGRKRHRRKNGTYTKDGERVDFTADIVIADPVDIPAVPVAPQPLDDYEEGTWTPDLVPSAELMPIHPQDVEEMWPLANELIASEIPKTDWSAGELKEACQRGAALLWMICKGDEAVGAMVTIVSPQTERCLVAICSGNNLWDYLEARHQLYDWAKGIGMKEVTFYGRDALVKLMPECKRVGVILRKEL